ncbi:hypothetical protein [Nocardia vaccinii]|uniref:hypothetical protein n=1 Tax=Nocardia vaccinii TaxID=1822 RepID=UPI000831D3EE|nr:hypothetical protein [Nocardia vaccinii]
MRHDIPADPNPFITAWLVGPECKAMMTYVGFVVQQLYRALEVKRTGEMAASAVVDVHLGGVKHDRYITDVWVTDPGAPAHIFGAGNHSKSTGRHFNRPTPTLQSVLRLMSTGAA